jgi:hypothetical protein
MLGHSELGHSETVESSKPSGAHRRRTFAVAIVAVALLAGTTVGTSVALAATPAGHTATPRGAAPEALSDLEGIAGEFNATSCQQVDPSSAYSISLVTTGDDAPYCKVALHGLGRSTPIATAVSYGPYSGFSVVIQGATPPRLDFQVWNSGSNLTGGSGAGLVMFIATKPTS